MSDKKQVAVSPREKFKGDLESRLPFFSRLLRGRRSPEQFVSQALIAVTRDDKLLSNCSLNSLMLALGQAAELGVSVSGGPGTQAYLVPYGRTCTLIVSARGYIEVALASGKVSTIMTGVRYKGDDLIDIRGTEMMFRHTPKYEHHEDADIIDAYAIAKMVDGSSVWEYMTRQQIDKRRAESKADGKGSPWDKWFPEMAKKTAVKALWKILPQTHDMEFGERLDTAGDKREVCKEGEAFRILDAEATVVAESSSDSSKEVAIKEVTDLRTNHPRIWAQIAGSSGVPLNCDFRTIEPETLDYLITAIKAELPK